MGVSTKKGVSTKQFDTDTNNQIITSKPSIRDSLIA